MSGFVAFTSVLALVCGIQAVHGLVPGPSIRPSSGGRDALRSAAPSRTRVASANRPVMFFSLGGVQLPKLYDGWFKKSRQIERDIVTATKGSLKVGKPVEVTFFPVPNIDEVQFGTKTNQEFGKEVALDLGMPPYKPGSNIKTYLVQFSNVYWAKKLADGLGGTVWAACNDGLKKDLVTKPGRAKLCSVRKPETLQGIKKGDTVIIVSPGPRDEWERSAARFKEQKVIFLNGLVSESYDLGGPLLGLEQAYYLKRISKGYVFRASPGKWGAYLEKPDGSLEVLESYKDRPLLRDVAKLVREESFNRFGMFNDRYAKGFGERL